MNEIPSGSVVTFIMAKIKIGGIKLSSELALVTLRHPPGAEIHRWRLWEKLAARHINVSFLSSLCTERMGKTAFAVAAGDRARTTELIRSEKKLKGCADFLPAVGALSLFPHHFSFEVLGVSLQAFSMAELPFYGLASSLSSLTFLTDYGLLDQAAAAMEKCLVLPRGQCPTRP